MVCPSSSNHEIDVSEKSNGDLDYGRIRRLARMDPRELAKNWNLESVNALTLAIDLEPDQESAALFSDSSFSSSSSSSASLSNNISATLDAGADRGMQSSLEKDRTANSHEENDNAETLLRNGDTPVNNQLAESSAQVPQPSSASDTSKQDPPRRNLRPRRDIQLRPFTLEGAQYRALLRHAAFDELLEEDDRERQKRLFRRKTAEDRYETEEDSDMDDGSQQPNSESSPERDRSSTVSRMRVATNRDKGKQPARPRSVSATTNVNRKSQPQGNDVRPSSKATNTATLHTATRPRSGPHRVTTVYGRRKKASAKGSATQARGQLSAKPVGESSSAHWDPQATLANLYPDILHSLNSAETYGRRESFSTTGPRKIYSGLPQDDVTDDEDMYQNINRTHRKRRRLVLDSQSSSSDEEDVFAFPQDDSQENAFPRARFVLDSQSSSSDEEDVFTFPQDYSHRNAHAKAYARFDNVLDSQSSSSDEDASAFPQNNNQENAPPKAWRRSDSSSNVFNFPSAASRSAAQNTKTKTGQKRSADLLDSFIVNDLGEEKRVRRKRRKTLKGVLPESYWIVNDPAFTAKRHRSASISRYREHIESDPVGSDVSNMASANEGDLERESDSADEVERMDGINGEAHSDDENFRHHGTSEIGHSTTTTALNVSLSAAQQTKPKISRISGTTNRTQRVTYRRTTKSNAGVRAKPKTGQRRSADRTSSFIVNDLGEEKRSVRKKRRRTLRGQPYWIVSNPTFTRKPPRSASTAAYGKYNGSDSVDSGFQTIGSMDVDNISSGSDVSDELEYMDGINGEARAESKGSAAESECNDELVKFLRNHGAFTQDFGLKRSSACPKLPTSAYIGRGLLAQLIELLSTKEKTGAAASSTLDNPVNVFGRDIVLDDDVNECLNYLRRLFWQGFKYIADLFENGKDKPPDAELDFNVQLRQAISFYHYVSSCLSSWILRWNMEDQRRIAAFFNHEIICLLSRVFLVAGVDGNFLTVKPSIEIIKGELPHRWKAMLVLLIYSLDWACRMNKLQLIDCDSTWLSVKQCSLRLLWILFWIGPELACPSTIIEEPANASETHASDLLVTEGWISLLCMLNQGGLQSLCAEPIDYWATILHLLESHAFHEKNVWEKSEKAWHWLFVLQFLQQYDSRGNLRRATNGAPCALWSAVQEIMNNTRMQMYEYLALRARIWAVEEQLDVYMVSLFQRCHTLMQKWDWRWNEDVLVNLFDFFRQRRFNGLVTETFDGFAHWFEDYKGSITEELENNDTCFDILLKMLCISIRSEVKEISACEDKKMKEQRIKHFRKTLSQLSPTHVMVVNWERRENGEITSHLSSMNETHTALANHYKLTMILLHAVPDIIMRRSLASCRSLLRFELSDKRARTIFFEAFHHLGRICAFHQDAACVRIVAMTICEKMSVVYDELERSGTLSTDGDLLRKAYELLKDLVRHSNFPGDPIQEWVDRASIYLPTSSRNIVID